MNKTDTAKLTVVCIDDEPQVLNAIKRVLRNAPFQIQTTTDPAEALELAWKPNTAVVLSDYRMPNVNGVQLLAQVREVNPAALRIMLTGQAGRDAVVDAINLGDVYKFLEKPWDNDVLYQTITQAVEFFQLQRENARLAADLERANKDLVELNGTLEARAENKARDLARVKFYDEITNLPNRTLAVERIGELVAGVSRGDSKFAVLFVSFDRVQEIRETYGNDVANSALCRLAGILRECARKSDTVAHIGPDKFCVLTPGTDTPEQTATFAHRLQSSLRHPIEIEALEILMRTSIGAAMCQGADDTADQLLNKAEVALGEARSANSDRISFYRSEHTARSEKRIKMENDLYRAVQNEEFELYLQPRIEAGSSDIIGAEALLRWNHPTEGQIQPGEFIPVLESTGLISTLGPWIFTEAYRLLKHIRDQGLLLPRISVNISARQFQDPELLPSLLDIAEKFDAPGAPRGIELEITESMLMADPEHARLALQALHDDGFKIALDDFGTGYSSLSYLIAFPLDYLKIDRSFVLQMGTNSNANAVIRTITNLAQSLRLGLVAEGVETSSQADALHVLGCEEFQGYLFSRPLPLNDFIGYLESHADADTRPVALIASA